jgi:hypothetical protein
MARFLEKFKPKSIGDLESDLAKLNVEFNVGQFDTLMGDVYDKLNKAIEHAELKAQYGKVKKLKDTEEIYVKRLDFLRALKTLKPQWKAAKEK